VRIDAHHHLWDLDVRDQEWTAGLPVLHRTYDVAELRPLLAAAGIERTVLVQTVAVADETPQFLGVAAGEGADVIAGVVGWVDLTAPDVGDVLDALRAGPGGDRLVGLRHLVQAHQSGSSDYSAPLWSLLMFEAFLRNAMGESNREAAGSARAGVEALRTVA